VWSEGVAEERADLLEAVEISAGYGREAIVKRISIGVSRGHATLVIGPNGSGKSTLVKAITGELPLMTGSVHLRGADISTWSEERRAAAGVGYVPQSRDVFPGLTVLENLEMGGYRLGRAGLREQIDRILGTFPQLRALLKRPARQLSGGERKLVGVAWALAPDPQLMILDEPTANLSPRVAETVLEQVVTGLCTLGHGVLLIEQRVAPALKRATSVFVLVDGELRHTGPAADLRDLADLSELFFGPRSALTRNSSSS